MYGYRTAWVYGMVWYGTVPYGTMVQVRHGKVKGTVKVRYRFRRTVWYCTVRYGTMVLYTGEDKTGATEQERQEKKKMER